MAKRKKKNDYIGIGLLRVAFFAILFAGLFATSNMYIQRQNKLGQLEANKAEIKKISQEVDRISKDIENSNSPEFIEKVARDELGMVKPREVIFIDKNKERQEKQN